jgi:hypothetical protein
MTFTIRMGHLIATIPRHLSDWGSMSGRGLGRFLISSFGVPRPSLAQPSGQLFKVQAWEFWTELRARQSIARYNCNAHAP